MVQRFAIFFPQFHQIEVNDQAWGHGFTDWALVATANAFEYWRRRSPKKGFYNLADEKVIEDQFSTAACSGLDGFAIYHYWFQDGGELGAVEKYLKNAKLPDNFKFFYIWANESWTKRWAGKSTDLLKDVSMEPSAEDIKIHVNYMKSYMLSASYTHVSGRPLFVIYRPDFFKNTAFTLECYRSEFLRAGINPLIGYCLKNRSDLEYSDLFDFCYLFEPRLFFNFYSFRQNKFIHQIYNKIIHYIPYKISEKLASVIANLFKSDSCSNKFTKFLQYFYSSERRQFISKLKCPVQNILTCGWNNAPRYREKFTELNVPDVNEFAMMMQLALQSKQYSDKLPLLCNAWNEWSEGAAIEPCHYLDDLLLKAYLSENHA